MEGSQFDEVEFFRAIERSGIRALLIGRRALVALGIPVLTADYDFWLDPDDIERLNEIALRFALHPTRLPEEARKVGRYVLENDEHLDVLVRRELETVDGTRLSIADLWNRRKTVVIGDGAALSLPSLDDLIATKRIASRPKDLEDIRLLEALRRADEGCDD